MLVFVWYFFLSGLKSIPGDIYEAARVDGVNSLQQLIYITIPNLRSSFFVGINMEYNSSSQGL